MLSFLILFLFVGFAHQLYVFVSLTGTDGLLGPRQVLSEVAAARRHISDVGQTTVSITAGEKACTGVPVRGTRIVLTAAHCLLTEAGVRDLPTDVSVVDYQGTRLGSAVATWVHPRYLTTTKDRLSAPLELVRNAVTWGSLRGEVLQRSPYAWDVGYILLDGPVNGIGVHRVGGDVTGRLSVFAAQLYRASGEPVCSLGDESDCPSWSSSATPEEQLLREEVRCDVRAVRPGYEIDLEMVCGLFPGASGGALVEHRGDEVLLAGILVSGDSSGAVNGVTNHSLTEVYDHALAAAS